MTRHARTIAALPLLALALHLSGHAEPVFFNESELYLLVGPEESAFDTGQLMQAQLSQIVDDQDELAFPLQAASDADLAAGTLGVRLLGGASFLMAMAATTTQLDTLRFEPPGTELSLPYRLTVDGAVLGAFTGDPLNYPPAGTIVWGFSDDAAEVAATAARTLTPDQGVMAGTRANARPLDSGLLVIAGHELSLEDLVNSELSENGMFEVEGSIVIGPEMSELSVYISIGAQLLSPGIDVNFSSAVALQFDPVPGFTFTRYSQTDLGDDDTDGVANGIDNCPQVPNTDQRDTDDDDFGNACDPDLDNNCLIDFADLQIYRLVVFTADDDADFDGNGAVDLLDLLIMKNMFFGPPGPGVNGLLCQPLSR